LKPFAESCEQNKRPILTVLRQLLRDRRHLLEIGSGTGQHAVYFAEAFPELRWQTSERRENLPGIHAWLADEGPANAIAPLALDVTQHPWPLPGASVDAVFSANTAHIMGWDGVEAMFAGIGEVLVEGGLFLLYGPFNYHGRYTTEGNARFDAWLKARDPKSGIRDLEALVALGERHGLRLYRDFAMPANNRMLVWVKAAHLESMPRG
jgi:cyclopropane fatty-acyl-phospholipid synthase-like methyltransferase